MRPSSAAIQRGSGTRSALWAHGISGDVPIVLLRIEHIEDLAIAQQLLQAHEYWRLKQLAVDLVILNERAASYVQDLQIALETAVRTRRSHPQLRADSAKGSVFVLRTDIISAETRARAVVRCTGRIRRRARHARRSTRPSRRILCSVPAGARRTTLRETARTAVATIYRARVLQWHGRIRRGRARVRDHARCRDRPLRRRGST